MSFILRLQTYSNIIYWLKKTFPKRDLTKKIGKMEGSFEETHENLQKANTKLGKLKCTLIIKQGRFRFFPKILYALIFPKK